MSKQAKNVLLITSDQQHWFTLGIQNPEIKTPNLDRLAKKGVVFTRAYCPNPTCTPTRASIITGRYPSQHGAWSLGTKLPESELTIGERLSEKGYATALVGKAHFQQLIDTPEYRSIESNPRQQNLDFWRGFHGPFYGFDHVELARNHTDEAHVGQHYALWMEEKGFKDWRKCFRQLDGSDKPQKWRWNIPEEYHYDTWIAERTNSLMEQYSKEGKPFFLWASFLDPHPPYLAPKAWAEMYDPDQLTLPEMTEGEHEANPPHFRMTQEKNPDFFAWREKDGNTMHGFSSHLVDRRTLAKNVAVYYGMISLMDKYIGKILDNLDELGLARDTLIVFTSDHGHFYGHHGLIAKGAFHYEDLIRIPFIVSQPGTVPENRTSAAMQTLVDLAPTFLSALGENVPRVMTGVDQTDAWTGKVASARDHVIVENRHQPTTIHVKTYVDERYKLTVYYLRDHGELFDLKEDPGETRNLWDEPSAKDLKLELFRKLVHAEMGKEPIWMPRVAGA